MVGFAFSGSGDPLLQLLNRNHTIDMKSVILLAAPLKYGRIITNPNVENIVLLGGEKDVLGSVFHSFEYSSYPVNESHILLKGIDHADYSYVPGDPNVDPLKIQAAEFIARVATHVNDPVDLADFLEGTPGIRYDNHVKIYIVDLEEVQYDD